MRALLDVNLLVAAVDVDHQAAAVHAWLDSTGRGQWATCPITQIGFIKVMSQPAYPRSVALSTAFGLLRELAAHPAHEFWPCDLSSLEPSVDASALTGHRQVTDVYLLALAVAHGGQLVTLDRAVPLNAVPGATPENLLVL